MHELSLAENMLSVIEQKSKQEAFTKVKSISLEVGTLSHVDQDALLFSFEAITTGSCAEGAEINIIHTDTTGYCQTCKRQSPMQQLYDPCPFCGTFGRQIVNGQDVRLISLEVE